MTRRVLVTVAVALLVLLAGCGGTAEPTADSPAETTSPDGPSPTPTVGLDDVKLPTGVSESGVTDADALVSAHADALSGESATVAMDFRLEVNGSGQNVSFRGKVTPDADAGWIQVTLQDGVGTYYTEAGTTYQRVESGGETTYGTTDEVSAIPAEPRFGADARIGDAVRAANWTATGVVERNGTRLIRMEATHVSVPDSVDVANASAVESSGVLLVDTEGVVHHVSVHTRVTADEKTVVYEIEVTVTDVGATTIQRPDWVDEAS
ncbi:MAG: hypothetical protein V5A23_02540 [Halobacteriales archaeon]